MARDAYKLAVFEQGVGEPIVLLHGQISTHNYMQIVADKISSQRHVISVDLLGFGDSPRPKSCDYTVDDHVEAIVNSVNILHPTTFVGHSMGSLIAIRLAKTHPQLAKSLVLSALPILKAGKEYKTLAKEFPGTKPVMHGLHAKAIHKWYEKDEQRAQKLVIKLSKRRYGQFTKQIRADTVRHSWEAYDRSMKQVVLNYDAIADMNKLTIPIEILYGEEDEISKNVAARIKNKSNVELQPIPRARHNLPLEHPDIVAQAILRV